MSGYTPVFDTVFTGTLCGKYPDTAAWLYLLALADKHGVVDMTPQYIATVTGMPLEDLVACLDRFTQPDPHSRTMAHEGRRLVPLDPDRPWGWQIVNHAKYREKARLQSKNAREVAEGQNRKRLAEKRETEDVTADDRRRPPVTAAERPSNANANKEEDSRRGDESPRDFIWRVGVDLLTSAGEKNSTARSFIGRLCKQHGDEAVREAVGRAAAIAPAEPKAWLQGALNRGRPDPCEGAI